MSERSPYPSPEGEPIVFQAIVTFASLAVVVWAIVIVLGMPHGAAPDERGTQSSPAATHAGAPVGDEIDDRIRGRPAIS